MTTATFETVPTVANAQAMAEVINRNFDAFEAALEKCLFRDGTLPNELKADLNMNGHSVFNATLGDDITLVPQDA